MYILDIAIVIIVALYAFRGYQRGFILSIVGILSLLGSLAAAYYLGTPARVLLESFQVHTTIETFLNTEVFVNNAIFDTNLTNQNLINAVQDGLTAIGIPSEIASPVITFLSDLNQPLGVALATGLTQLMMVMISFVLVFFIARIIISSMLRSVTKAVKEDNVSSKIDHGLGLIFGVAKGLVFVLVAIGTLMALSFVNPQINSLLVDQFHLDSDQLSIGKVLYYWISDTLAVIL
jgi:uncharacterized membrane protein required for colicin V production